jgi:hypothetical protein
MMMHTKSRLTELKLKKDRSALASADLLISVNCRGSVKEVADTESRGFGNNLTDLVAL